MKRFAAMLVPVLLVCLQADAQVLETKDGAPLHAQAPTRVLLSAASELDVSVDARLLTANASAASDGALLLVSVFEMAPQQGEVQLHGTPTQKLVISLPLSSVQEAYGEARSCAITKEGQPEFQFTAGEDEQNFVPFASMSKGREFHFLLNKYLCRALAAPFHCSQSTAARISATSDIRMEPDMSRWKLVEAHVQLQSSGSAARVSVEPVKIKTTGRPFDYARCAILAPSDGVCCVQHKTTDWHCGGSPIGDGWHQVSGDCYHRETGGSCKE
jgi:hypothetical protein